MFGMKSAEENPLEKGGAKLQSAVTKLTGILSLNSLLDFTINDYFLLKQF
jgi:hypothetical protein